MSSALSTESNWRTSGLKRTKIGSVDQDPDPYCEYGSGTTLPIEYGSNMDPDPQPCLGLHKVCPGYRRSLQLTKEAIQHFKTWIFSTFFWVIFALLDPGTDPDPDPMVRLNTDPIRIRVPDPDPDPQHWSKVHYNEIFCSDFELCTFHCKLCSKIMFF